MKKLVSLMMAVLLTGVLPCMAFAVGAGETATHDVTGQYKSGGESSVVYSVDISWDDMSFTYTDAFKGTWNPTMHQYEGATPASWSPESATIQVTNHSNTEITATLSYQAESGCESATLIFSEASVTVESADNGEGGQAGVAKEKSLTVTPNGSLPAQTDGKIGTITILVL